jgi:hypothetical protein
VPVFGFSVLGVGTGGLYQWRLRTKLGWGTDDLFRLDFLWGLWGIGIIPRAAVLMFFDGLIDIDNNCIDLHLQII